MVSARPGLEGQACPRRPSARPRARGSARGAGLCSWPHLRFVPAVRLLGVSSWSTVAGVRAPVAGPEAIGEPAATPPVRPVRAGLKT